MDELGLFVRDLITDPSYTAEDRVELFRTKFSGSRPTYFRHQLKVEQRLGIKSVPCDYAKRDERIKAEATAKLRVAPQDAPAPPQAGLVQSPTPQNDAQQPETAADLRVVPEEAPPSTNGDDVQGKTKKGRPRKEA